MRGGGELVQEGATHAAGVRCEWGSSLCEIEIEREREGGRETGQVGGAGGRGGWPLGQHTCVLRTATQAVLRCDCRSWTTKGGLAGS